MTSQSTGNQQGSNLVFLCRTMYFAFLSSECYNFNMRYLGINRVIGLCIACKERKCMLNLKYIIAMRVMYRNAHYQHNIVLRVSYLYMNHRPGKIGVISKRALFFFQTPYRHIMASVHLPQAQPNLPLPLAYDISCLTD